MSHIQDPQKAFFPHGNPFRMMFPKGSSPSPKLLALLNNFEETLAGKLIELKPAHKDDVFGTGSIKDEHLVPGRGDQQAGRVLQYLAEQDFSGHIVIEVNLRRSVSRAQREADLAESLAFARLHLAAPVYPSYAVDAGGVASAL